MGLSGFTACKPMSRALCALRQVSYANSPGLNYHLPWPIETAVTPKVTTENLVDIGMRASTDRRAAGVTRDVPEEA